ncbi:carbohydrate kinase family protein [Nocardia sp. NPDC088792]|uniref:carbohydrate kinase family protein n=1 Tax=Nocardia sp. NPDC088792 TaxID=3364332 RepID=UPI0037F73631
MTDTESGPEVLAMRDLLRRLCTWSGLTPDRLTESAIDANALLALRIVREESARTGTEPRYAAVEIIRELVERLPVTPRIIADAELALGLLRKSPVRGIDPHLLYAPNLGARRDFLVTHWHALHKSSGTERIPRAPTTRSLRARPEDEAFTALAALLIAASSGTAPLKISAAQRDIRPGGIGSVVVVGEAVIDRILRVRRLPSAGTAETGHLMRHPGGKGFYRAICAAHLGLDVQLIAVVGSDADSYRILDFLGEQNVGTGLVKVVANASAPETDVTVADDGSMTYIPIAQRVRLDGADLRVPARQQALTTADVVLVTFEQPAEVTVETLRTVKAVRRTGGRGPQVILHPSPPVNSADQLRGLLGVIDAVDYVIGTTWELRTMLPDSEGLTNPDVIAQRLRGLRVGTVCLLENYRCTVRSDSVHTTISAAQAASLKDSPGARSAFAAALAYRFVLSRRAADIEDLRWATASMIATQNYIESPGVMPTVDEIDSVLHLAVEEA